MTDGNSTYPTADPGYTSTDTADTEVAFTDDAADTEIAFTDDAADTEIAFTDDAADTDVDFTNGAVDADFDPNLLPADPNTTDLEDLIEIWPGPRPSFLFPSRTDLSRTTLLTCPKSDYLHSSSTSRSPRNNACTSR